MPWNDLSGKRFGKLTVVKFDHQDRTTMLNFYQCKCDCGNTIIARGVFLRKGFTKSCGCPVETVVEEQPAAPVVIGQKVRFDPFLHITGFSSEMNRGKKVTGTVIYVNEPNKWFSVEYGKPKARTSFKFCDLGHGVQVVK